MTKEEMLKKLGQLKLDKDKYIVIGGAALVLQNLIEESDDIDLACSKEYYESIDWDCRIGYFNSEIKYYDCFELGSNFYDMSRVDIISSYLVANIEACYDLKKLENKKKDKKIIQELDLVLCLQDNYRYERDLKKQKVNFIAGVDEVGRGPLVGPVVAACVVLPDEFSLDGLTDSKKLNEKKREEFFEKIEKQALGIGIGIIDEKKIDEINIYEATKLAMKEAINKCQDRCKIDHVLIDAMPLDLSIPTTSIIKGDLKSITISAASVIAKVTRDRMLDQLDKIYPMYDFKNNKGYPTKKHLEAIDLYGIIAEHRKSYGPVKNYIENHKKVG